MASWTKYGKFLKISAGISLVSGGLYIGTYTRGQHVAEINAAVIERNLLWKAVGEPDFFYYHSDTNRLYMNANLSWTKLYDETMVIAREMATEIVPVGNTGYIGWLVPDDPPVHGTILAEAGCTWEPTSTNAHNNAWRLSPHTNLIQRVHSTATVYPHPDVNVMPDVGFDNDATRMPVANAAMGKPWDPIVASTNAENATAFGGANNAWTHWELGTDIYKYQCERWYNVEQNIEFSVVNIGGSPYTAVTNLVAIPTDGSSADVEFSLKPDKGAWHSNPYMWYANAYKFTSEGVLDAYGVVYAPPVSRLSYRVSTELVDVTESEEDQEAFEFWLNNNVEFYWPVTINFVVSTPSTMVSVSPSSLTFTKETAFIKQKIHVKTGTWATGSDRVGIISFGESQVTQRLPVVIRGTGDKSKATGIEVDPISALIPRRTVGHLSVSTTNIPPPYMTVSKYVNRGNPKDTKKILNKLVDTIAVFDPTDFNLFYPATNTVVEMRGGDFYTNSPPDFEGTQHKSMGDAVAAAATAYSANNGYLNVTWPTMFKIKSEGLAYNRFYGPEGQNLGWGLQGDSRTAALQNYGLQTKYPCPWAITNGFVKSFEVYGVFVCPPADSYYIGNGWTETLTATTADAPFNYYESYLFNFISEVAKLPPTPETVWYDKPTKEGNLYRGTSVVGPDNGHRLNAPLTLLATVPCEGLEETPYFDIAFPPLAGLPISSSDYLKSSAATEGQLGGVDWRTDDHGCIFETYLKLSRIVIVVHWDWDHCNPDKPDFMDWERDAGGDPTNSPPTP